MTVALGYIFMDYVRMPRTEYSVLGIKEGFNWEDFKFAALITAPGIVLHELAHKFLGLAFGLSATFQASYFGLAIGVLLKLMHSPFILFIPGYVSLQGTTTALGSALTALVGPLANLFLFLTSNYILHHRKHLTKKQAVLLYATKQINLFLFIFNMLPIPPFDGFQFISGLISAL